MFFFRFWLLGFLASRLLGFSASGLFGFLLVLVVFWLWLFASSAFPVPLRQVAFYLFGFSLVCAAFGGFGFSNPLLSQFLSGLLGFCTLSLVFGFGFPHHQHHQFLPI